MIPNTFRIRDVLALVCVCAVVLGLYRAEDYRVDPSMAAMPIVLWLTLFLICRAVVKGLGGPRVGRDYFLGFAVFGVVGFVTLVGGASAWSGFSMLTDQAAAILGDRLQTAIDGPRTIWSGMS
ncbi:MAG: hypothetical protein KGM43_07115 [Planctomycetota bacterium]|nr:hypothetical protein [Planctomycetota bacterium]